MKTLLLAIAVLTSSAIFAGSTCLSEVACSGGSIASCHADISVPGDAISCGTKVDAKSRFCTTYGSGGGKATDYVCCDKDGNAISFSDDSTALKLKDCVDIK